MRCCSIDQSRPSSGSPPRSGPRGGRALALLGDVTREADVDAAVSGPSPSWAPRRDGRQRRHPASPSRPAGPRADPGRLGRHPRRQLPWGVHLLPGGGAPDATAGRRQHRRSSARSRRWSAVRPRTPPTPPARAACWPSVGRWPSSTAGTASASTWSARAAGAAADGRGRRPRGPRAAPRRSGPARSARAGRRDRADHRLPRLGRRQLHHWRRRSWSTAATPPRDVLGNRWECAAASSPRARSLRSVVNSASRTLNAGSGV